MVEKPVEPRKSTPPGLRRRITTKAIGPKAARWKKIVKSVKAVMAKVRAESAQMLT